MDVEVALRKLAHDAVDIRHIFFDALHGLAEGLGQRPKLVVRMVVQLQRQIALLERLAPPGDGQDRPDNLPQNIEDQADEGDEGKRKAHDGGYVHHHNGALHLGGAGVVYLGALLHHLVQHPHQLGEILLDGGLIIALGAAGVAIQPSQNLGGRLVKLLVEGLHLAAQLEYLFIIGAGLAIEPLAQHAGGGVDAAGKFRSGVQGVAQVAGPLVMGGFRLLGPVQHIAGRCALLLAAFDGQDVHRHHNAEHQHRQEGHRYPNADRTLDAFFHKDYTSPFCLCT